MGNKNSNLAIVTPKNKNSNLNITTSNVSLERLVELYLNWNYNSDIINIICDYINLQPIKVKYHRVSQDIIGYDGPRKAPGAFHMCNDCHQICNDEKKHDLECIVRRNCLNCQYQGKSNTEYLEHKQNNCPMSLMKCQYCNIEKLRMDMDYHYSCCKKLFQCNKCKLPYTKDNKNLHKLLC